MSSTILEHFFRQCAKVNLEESLEEEKERYEAIAYSDRIINFIAQVQQIKEKGIKNNA